MEEKEFEFKDFKQKQAHYKRINKERGKFLSVSKYDYEYRGNGKGRTYTKPKKIIMKESENNV